MVFCCKLIESYWNGILHQEAGDEAAETEARKSGYGRPGGQPGGR